MIGQRPHRRPNGRLVAGALIVATLAIGSQTFAGDDERDGEPAPPGTPILDAGQLLADSAGDGLIGGDGGEYDPTILTKFIPARGFVANQGSGVLDGGLQTDDLSCVRPSAASGGDETELWAPVELPDGARIKRITFFGQDHDVAEPEIAIALRRSNVQIPVGIGYPTRTDSTVVAFSTTGATALATIVSSPDDLGEVTGRIDSGSDSTPGPVDHRFHSIRVVLNNNVPASSHVLCGVEVQYQVKGPAASSGSVFHPIDPVRVFDSRIATYPDSGLLAPNSSKIVSIKDGYALDGMAIPGQAGSVPADATAVSFNVAIAGPTGSNFVSVTSGDAAAYTTATLTYSGQGSLANGAITKIAADRTIKVWGGDGAGSAHVVIDVSGYYAPAAASPNMAN